MNRREDNIQQKNEATRLLARTLIPPPEALVYARDYFGPEATEVENLQEILELSNTDVERAIKKFEDWWWRNSSGILRDLIILDDDADGFSTSPESPYTE